MAGKADEEKVGGRVRILPLRTASTPGPAVMHLLRAAVAVVDEHRFAAPVGAGGHEIRLRLGWASLTTHDPSPLPATLYMPRTDAPTD